MRYIVVLLVLLTGCTPCQRMGAAGGAATFALAAVIGAYVTDSSQDLAAKCGGTGTPGQGCNSAVGGEPLDQVFEHHVNTANSMMLAGGLAGVVVGAVVGTLVAHAYCDAPDDPTPFTGMWQAFQ